MTGPRSAIETVRSGDEVSLVVTGELDLAMGPYLEQAAERLLREQPRQLVLDLREVSFCDSSGLASLVRIQRAATQAASRLALHNVDQRVRQMFELGGVSEFLGVREDPPPGQGH